MTSESGNSPVYSMGVAERLTGLTARQIRYWEHSGLLIPGRTKGRQRMYSEGDILRLKEIKRLMGEGMTLERVKAYFANREAKKTRPSMADSVSSRMSERIPRVGSLYTGSNRAELERMMLERKPGK
ncbi:MAG TPA: MerR family transcriptional regulator [Symbiobacteriaceae bacterium]|nr:MerR family transcriptional regulator [Symbiobacteriaceae bacterium]